MSTTEIVRTCATLNEAYICRGLLQTHGIHASIDNAEHAAVDWFIIQGLGGVRIRVPISQYELAKTAIIQTVEHARNSPVKSGEEYEPSTRSQRRKAWVMMFFWFGFFNAIVLFLIIWLETVIPHEWFPEPPPCKRTIPIPPPTESMSISEQAKVNWIRDNWPCDVHMIPPIPKGTVYAPVIFSEWLALPILLVFSLRQAFVPVTKRKSTN